eukprot:Nk52_evm65s164 gene=Nk52_evmTU65s164
MALPHMASYRMSKYLAPRDLDLYRRRNSEAKRQVLLENATNQQNERIQTCMRHNWERDLSAHSRCSVESWEKVDAREKKLESVRKRREALKDLLVSEEKDFKNELKSSYSEAKRYAEVKSRLENMKLKKEQARKKDVEERYRAHWRMNNPEFREKEREKLKENVFKTRNEQLGERAKKIEIEKENEKEFDKLWEKDRQKKIERERSEAKMRKLKQEEVNKVLHEQVKELRLKRQETERLKQEYDEIVLKQVELQAAEDQRRIQESEKKKSEYRAQLNRQHTARMRRMSRKIQEELENDMTIIQDAMRVEENALKFEEERKQTYRQDISHYLKYIEEQKLREVKREQELSLLYKEEAEELWKHREKEWEREAEARGRLMKEVLGIREQQLKEHLEKNLKAQEEALDERQRLMEDVQTSRKLAQLEAEQRHKLIVIRKQELEEQIKDRAELEKFRKLYSDQFEAELTKEEDEKTIARMRQEENFLTGRPYEILKTYQAPDEPITAVPLVDTRFPQQFRPHSLASRRSRKQAWD